MAVNPGDSLGSYRIIEQIGKGGMATVFRASQPSLSRQVAIKVLPEFFAQDPAFHERFRQEAMAIAKLRHPNILTVFDSGESGGVAYIVTELLDGGTLARKLGKPLPIADVIALVKPIASALDYAHARGMVHRDVKPTNILLSDDGTPILSDFGLARMTSAGNDAMTRLTTTGMALGTPEYMAPEQIRAKDVGPSADIYALAVMLYEMLTGSVPHTGDTPIALMMSRLNDPLPPPRERNPDLPEAVQDVVLKGLSVEPADRYASASGMIRALELASAEPFAETVSVRTPTPVPAVHRAAVGPNAPTIVAPQAARKTPFGLMIGAAVVVLGVVGAWLVLSRGGSTTGSATPPATPTPSRADAATPPPPATTSAASPSSVPSSPVPTAAANPAAPKESAPGAAPKTSGNDGLPPHGRLLYSLTTDPTIAARPLQHPDDKIVAAGGALVFTASTDQGIAMPLPVNGVGDFVAVLKYRAIAQRASLNFRFHVTPQGEGQAVRLPLSLHLAPPGRGAPSTGLQTCCQPFDFFLTPQKPDSQSIFGGPQPLSIPASPNEEELIAIAATGSQIVVSAGREEIARVSNDSHGAGGINLGVAPYRGQAPVALTIEALDVFDPPEPTGGATDGSRRGHSGASGPAAPSGPPAQGRLLYSIASDLTNLARIPQAHAEDTVIVGGQALEITAGSPVGALLALPVNGIGDFVAVFRVAAVSRDPVLNFRFHQPSQPGGVVVQIPASLRLLPPPAGEPPEGAHVCCHAFEIYLVPLTQGDSALFTGPAVRTVKAPANEEQTITVVAKGPLIVVYADGQEIARAEDSRFGAGRMSLQVAARGKQTPAVMRLNAFEIHEVK